MLKIVNNQTEQLNKIENNEIRKRVEKIVKMVWVFHYKSNIKYWIEPEFLITLQTHYIIGHYLNNKCIILKKIKGFEDHLKKCVLNHLIKVVWIRTRTHNFKTIIRKEL